MATINPDLSGIVDGAVPGAAAWVTPFNTIINLLNGGLDTANLSTTAGIVATQLSNPYRARVWQNVAQSISTGAITKVTFDTKSYDSNTNFDIVTNRRYTAPIAGYYLVNVNVTIASSASGQRVIAYIYKNGSSWVDSATSTGVATNNGSHVMDVMQLAAGDYVEGFVFQDAGSSKNTAAFTTDTFMSVHLLSAN